MKRLALLFASLLVTTVDAATFRILAPDNGSGLSVSSDRKLYAVIGGPMTFGTSTNGTVTNHNPFFPTSGGTVTPPPPPVNPPLPLETVKVIAYPNPLRPHMGDRGVQFVNLEAGATIKIMTVVGELIRTLYTDSNGKVFWDGTNDDGQQVASGIYLVFINESGKTRVVKIGVER